MSDMPWHQVLLIEKNAEIERLTAACARMREDCTGAWNALGEVELENDNLAAELASARQDAERLRDAIKFAAYQLKKARMLDGADWVYTPLHQNFYFPALERLAAAIGEKACTAQTPKR